MCALCGAFGVVEHWTDRPAGERAHLTATRERQQKANAANGLLGLYGLKLAAWGSRYTLTSRTGKMAVVEHFGALWPAAEKLAGRACDPLDPEVIALIEEMEAR
jgi:hypothetical protein